MKKLFLVVAALSMLATACTKDDAAVVGNDSLVSFTIDSPELATRYGEGTTATNLEWAFYDETGTKLDAISSSINNFSGAYTFDVSLVEGRQYTALFWASAPDAPYTVDWADKKMTIDYANLTANNEAYDAFYKYAAIDPAKKTHKIELTRPFAQLNIATADTTEAENAGVEVKVTKVTVENAYNTLNFVDGSVEGATTFTYTWAAKATGTVKTDYQMLSMNYVLVHDRELVNVSLRMSENEKDATSDDDDSDLTRTYSTVPVQRNYQTYILGNLLTTSNEFEVETKPGFGGEEIYEVWDGKTKTKPAYDADTKTYTVKTGAELAWLADLVNGTLPATMRSTEYAAADDLAGEIIELTDNIDLGGNEWTPIGCDKSHFKGTFEGNDYIISNFKITKRHNSDRAALFGTVSGTVAFRNFTIQNASIVCPDFDADFYGAGLIGTFYGKVTIEKVHVKDSYISGNNKVGALAAHDGVCSALKIDECSAEGVTFEATNTVDGGLVGGLVGFFQGQANGEYYLKNSSVKNCNFNVVNSTNTGKRANAQLIGGISSKVGQTLVVENCEVANNTWNEKFYVDGVEVTVDTLEPLCGVYVGGERNDALVGELIVDGVKVIANGIGEDAEGNHVVSSEAGLEYIAEQVNNGNTDWTDADIVLSRDIDLASFVTRSAATSNWTPIGTPENPFTGSFNGNGNTIKNLCIVETEAKEGKAYIGFFGYAKNVEIKNVTFENVYLDIACLDIDHSQGHIGAVAGSLEGTSTIENVTVKGDVKVEATFDANGASRVAVVAGGNIDGNVTMKNVHVIANEGSYLKANNNVGALAGQLQVKNVFENCSSNIDVTAKKFYAGGIIGLAAGDSKFTNCHTTGNITVTAGREGRHNDEYRVGGIAGGWADNVNTPCVLENCSYTGVISGTNADGAVANPLDYAGYVGRGYTLSNCAGSKVVINGVEYVQADNATYGVYTVDGDYEMNTLADMQWLANKVNTGAEYFAGKTVKLANDIDLNNVEWTPIGTETDNFEGNFDGNNKVVKNLKITTHQNLVDAYGVWAYAGLFGVTAGSEDAHNSIKNFTIENVTIESTGDIVAAAVAYPYYTDLENITVTGDVNIKGGNYTAGVVAYTRRCVNAKDLTIAANEGSVIEGNMTVGGVISDIQTNGGLTANYSNFAASGLTIKATQNVGGIAGIIGGQSLDGATVKNVTIVCDDTRAGIVIGSWGEPYTLTNVSYENVTGATRVVGATWGSGNYVGQIVEVAGAKAVVFDITNNGVKAVSVEQGGEMKWDEAMEWAESLGTGWALASLEELQTIYSVKAELNDALEADSAENALFWEGDKEDDGTYAAYWSSTLVEGSTTKAHYMYFDNKATVMSSFTMIPVEYSRAVVTIK